MSRKRTVVPAFLVSELCPFDYFFTPPPPKKKKKKKKKKKNKSCTPHNSVTLWDIFMKLYRNEYQVKTKCRVQLWLLSLSSFKSNDPLIVFLCLFCVIFILVHTITHSLFMIYSCNL